MSKLSDALKAGKFVVTTELNPPKGTDLAPLLQKAENLRDIVDAFNLTDSHSSRMTMAPLAAGRLLVERDIEPVLQLTCRDRNRIALQGDLLAAYALGIRNVVCMTGDHPSAGDHPEARPVFDLEAISLLLAISSLASGLDINGNQLRGTPKFFTGAVANPGAADLDKELRRMGDKVESGAGFFQTQAVYSAGIFEKFIRSASRHNVPIIAGYIMLKSGHMARSFNAYLPGVHISDEVIKQLDEASDPTQKSVELAGKLISEIRPMCQGVHLIAVGLESYIPRVLEAAGIASRV